MLRQTSSVNTFKTDLPVLQSHWLNTNLALSTVILSVFIIGHVFYVLTLFNFYHAFTYVYKDLIYTQFYMFYTLVFLFNALFFM